MLKYLLFFPLLFLMSVSNTGCFKKFIQFNRGFIITEDNAVHRGYINIDECHNAFIEYKQTKNDTANVIPLARIRALKVANDSFIVIKKRGVRDINIRYYNYKEDIITRVEEYGAVLLLSHCSVEYQSSMFTTEKYILYSHILVTKDQSNYYRVSYNPQEFIQIAEIFFKDNRDLMDEIAETDYATEIINVESGEKSIYHTVSSKQIKDYVKKYNEWIKQTKKINKSEN